MPANLSPDYKKAEQAYRAAANEAERLACLREMLRTIPKHKGTEHLQADIKSRIKQLTEDLAAPKRGGARSGPQYVIRTEGAAQIALIGPPNAGKSMLHVALTGSKADVGPYPYTTQEPVPGMAPCDDVQFQLIDLPPITEDYYESWFTNALQPADAALLVIDISDPDCTDHITTIIEQLDRRKITLTSEWPCLPSEAAPAVAEPKDQSLDPFRQRLPTLLVANKIDLNADPRDIDALSELTGHAFPALGVSAKTGQALASITSFLFEALGIVRIYTKTPGKQAEMKLPFTLRRGATVHDVATLVHKDIAGRLRYARAWGHEVYDGQQVGPDHVVRDRDVIELHMR